jgi:hypothetical protein
MQVLALPIMASAIHQPLQWEMFRGKFPKNELTIGRNTPGEGAFLKM